MTKAQKIVLQAIAKAIDDQAKMGADQDLLAELYKIHTKLKDEFEPIVYHDVYLGFITKGEKE